jgi:hypothetical protein
VKTVCAATSLVLWLILAGCAGVEVRVTEIPAVPSDRIRIFVRADQQGDWNMPFREFADISIAKVSAFWAAKGIYQVVDEKDVDAAVGPVKDRVNWGARGGAVACEVARAVHAEYAMIVERERSGAMFSWNTTLINAESGRRFRVSMRVSGGYPSDFQPVIAASYEQIFRDATQDLLSTAAAKANPAARAPAAHSVPPRESRREVDLAASQQPARADTKQVAVYDLDSTEQNRLVALILSEALRQEILKQGLFALVSRESTAKVMEEMALQMTGMIDEKQALRVGKGLAVQQVVLGQYGNLGKSSVLQVKRVDVETQRTLGSAALRCEAGREDELLDGIAGMAKELAAAK